VEFRPDFKKEEDRYSGGSLASEAADNMPELPPEAAVLEELEPVNF
jgi:hypothetical protein